MNSSLGDITNIRSAQVEATQEKSVKRPTVHIEPTGKTAGPPQAFTQSAVKEVKTAGIRLSEVPQVTYGSHLQEQLKPGDILLSYYPKSTDVVAFGIKGSQGIAKVLSSKGAADSHNFVHAAIYVGNGKVSEAVGDGIRINDLSRLEPTEKSAHKILVVRHENSALAQEAANIAAELSADEPGQTSSHEYSILKALGAVVSDDNTLKEDGVKRFLKGAAYTGLGIKPTDANGIREFYCSYFIGWALHAGEAKDVFEKVNKSLPQGMAPIRLPMIDLTLPPDKQGALLEKWASDVTNTYYPLLKDAIQLQIDPKFSTPQHLYMYFLENPDVFSQEMLIEPAPREMKERANTVNTLALSSLHLEPLAEGKDKRVWVVSKQALLQMSPQDRAKWEHEVFIAPIKSDRQKLVRQEFELMHTINEQLGANNNKETHLALDFEKVRTADGKEYYTMKKAGNNAEKVIRDPAIPFDTRVSWCRQAIQGASNLHKTNRVHGDVKPDNLLIFEDATLRVSDFGKSAVVDENNPSSKSYSGNTRFGPPEGKVSKAGDVYGNGLVMIRMLEEACLGDRDSLIDVDR